MSGDPPGTDPTLPAGLEGLARAWGVMPSFRPDEAKDARVRASPEALVHVLRVLGAPIIDAADAPEALRARKAEVWGRRVEPSAVARSGDTSGAAAFHLDLRLAVGALDRPIDLGVETEEGEILEGRLDPSVGEVVERKDVGGAERVRVRARLPFELPDGVHRAFVRGVGREETSTLISAPRRAFIREERGWGFFLPLYALRHAGDGGVGDYPALGRLLRWTAERGGEAVGTLPLLPTALEEPFDPAPYAPLSRLFWSEAYVEPGAARAAPAPVPPDLRERLERLREAPRVEWREAWAVRRALLERAAARFFEEGGEADPAFRAFLERRPEVEAWARFRAVMDARGEPWSRWPAHLSGGEIPDGEAPEEGVRFHRWAQWVAETQMETAAGAGDEEAGLYLDLPLGTSAHGFDVWRHRALFAEGATGGAPPDLFHPGGQDWGFPPLHPHRIRQEGFEHFREVLRHHMRPSRLLRIDHVMSLHRLYWVPEGLGARDGVYIRYPAEELHALVRLESHRHRCEVVGEDLGTVPAEVRRAMDRDRMRKMWVLPFEFEEDPGDADPTLRPPPSNALATLNTHDLPTFAAYWRGVDLEEAAAAGHLAEEEAREERARRETLRGALEGETGGGIEVGSESSADTDEAGALGGGEPATEGPTGLDSLLRRTLRLLADSAARIVVISLEDLWLETVPHNRPAGPPKGNWRARARHRLEEVDGLEEVRDAIEALGRGESPGA